MFRSAFFTALATLSLATPALSQGGTGYQHSSFDINWPTDPSYGTGNFKPGSQGQYTGDQRNHAVYIRGNTAVVLFNPSFSEGMVPIPTLANDVATLPGDQWAIAGANDVMIIVGGNGLELWAFRPDLTFLKLTLDTSIDFQNARQVAVADVNGDGLGDILVLDQGGYILRVKEQTAGGGFTTSTTYGYTSTNEIHDFVLGDFTSASGPEVALITSQGLEIRELDGTSITSYASPQASLDSMDLLKGTGASGYDQVVWSSANAQGASPAFRVYTADANSSIYHDGTDREIATTTTGYLNLGDNPDVVLTVVDDDAILFLYSLEQNGSLTFSFDTSQSETVAIAGTQLPGPDYAKPLVHDFSHSGRDDLLYPIQGLLAVQSADSPLSAQASDWDPPTSEQTSLVLQMDLVPNSNTYYDTMLPSDETLFVRVAPLDPTIDLSTYWVEILIYEKSHSGSFNSNPVHEILLPLDHSSITETTDPSGDTQYLDIPTPLHSSAGDYNDTSYFQELRLVEYDSTLDEILDSGTTKHGFLDDNGPQPFRTLMLNNYAVPGTIKYSDVDAYGGMGGQRINGFLACRRLFGPSFPPPS